MTQVNGEQTKGIITKPGVSGVGRVEDMNNDGTAPKGANRLYFIACGNRQFLVVAESKDKALKLSDLPTERSIVREWDGRKTFAFGKN